MGSNLTTICRFAVWGLTVLAFLLLISAGNRGMVMADAGTSITYIAAPQDNTIAAATIAGCANMARCSSHVSGHCVTVDLTCAFGFGLALDFASLMRPIQANLSADIAPPTGLMRPPIV